MGGDHFEPHPYWTTWNLAGRWFFSNVEDVKTISESEACSDLNRLIDRVNEENIPVRITGKKSDAVLMSVENFLSIDETLYLLNIHGMRESILDGMKTPVEECSKTINL
jgi:antitoxin YefM